MKIKKVMTSAVAIELALATLSQTVPKSLVQAVFREPTRISATAETSEREELVTNGDEERYSYINDTEFGEYRTAVEYPHWWI